MAERRPDCFSLRWRADPPVLQGLASSSVFRQLLNFFPLDRALLFFTFTGPSHCSYDEKVQLTKYVLVYDPPVTLHRSGFA